MRGKFYIVGTPIGNLADITLRALETLRGVDFVACEDTRHSLRLLNYYEIKKPLISCHEHNERDIVDKLSALLEDGKNIAMITDAGMPAISDPGAVVVKALRGFGHDISVVPSATAVTSAIAFSGITDPIWTFVGFLPNKIKEKDLIVKPFVEIQTALVFYCSPHDFNKDCAYLFKTLGERKVHVVKELTKVYETHFECLLSECKIDEPKGEYVVIVERPDIQVKVKSKLSIGQQVMAFIAKGLNKKDAIKAVAKENGVPKDVVYKEAMEIVDTQEK